jgi:deazaflavin-dependent oxidoreductase (nitroreductase family)
MAGSHAYLRPGWFIQKIANPLVSRLGVATTLAVRGRKSGEWRRVPVNVLEMDGARYLVAPRGTTEWVRNLRVAGDGQLERGGNAETFRATEVPDEQKLPIIDAYLQRWRSQVASQFAALPNPSDHPVFRIEAISAR